MEAVSDELSELEDRIEETQDKEFRKSLGSIRRRAVILRRYLVPQRDVFTRLQFDGIEWFYHEHRNRFRECTDQLLRVIEDLDMIRERALVAQDLLETYMAENLNKAMYWLTVVAAIFLPLSLLTGLLGINVGGIPLAENAYGFAIVCLFLGIVCAAQIILFRMLNCSNIEVLKWIHFYETYY